MAAPHPAVHFKGIFWQVQTPERAVTGELTLSRSRPALEVIGQLFVERSVEVDIDDNDFVRRIGVRGRAADRVSDWEPRNIHGTLDDGTPVSMVQAQGRLKRPLDVTDFRYRQRFTTLRHVVLGEHIDDQTAFYGCRYRITGPIWYEQALTEADTADGGHVRVTHEGDTCLMEYVPTKPMTIKDLSERVLSPSRTLASIVSHNPSGTNDFAVRLTADSPWREVHGEDQSSLRGTHELLGSPHLTADRVARWIDFRTRSGALDAAAIDARHGATVQTQVLTLASVAEGLHRRICPSRKRIPNLSAADEDRARRAARAAAVQQLRDSEQCLNDLELGEFTLAITQALSSINDLTFRTRMAELATIAATAAPSIVSEFTDWPTSVQKARNILAHQGTQPPGENLDRLHDLLMALYYSIAWVLRTVLLVEAGFDGPTLQRAFNDYPAYAHHLANVRSLLAGTEHAPPPPNAESD
ncbi:HEPN domain-containing protein [Mycolicibacterium vinylchloridicum]|uniref:HEPN domain-containing protein n=1 Tax=Mycolicibacterium vinylchloridicum TaxID=2736928 RepID=UPI00022E3D66|nr:HEPN domain-containing protein [Mycolicibacterium vinylchloridicum]EHB46422.1 hypothetical protein MycrhDRAFT_6226 [Mycolicibacterium rhodesiae JS60]